MAVTTLKKRISKLEADRMTKKGGNEEAPKITTIWTGELSKKLFNLTREILGSLDEQYKQGFLQDLEAVYIWKYGPMSYRCSPPAHSGLMSAVIKFLCELLNGHYTGPAIMPGDLPKYYLQSHFAFGFHRCDACDYPMPMHTEPGMASTPVAEKCPVCKVGDVGYHQSKQGGALTAYEVEEGLARLWSSVRKEMMYNSMGKEFAELYEDEITDGFDERERWIDSKENQRGTPLQVSMLPEFFIFVWEPHEYHMMNWIKYHVTPAAMPPSAVEAIKIHEREQAGRKLNYTFNCENCLYPAPRFEGVGTLSFWASCVVCGGKVDYKAFEKRQERAEREVTAETT